MIFKLDPPGPRLMPDANNVLSLFDVAFIRFITWFRYWKTWGTTLYCNFHMGQRRRQAGSTLNAPNSTYVGVTVVGRLSAL